MFLSFFPRLLFLSLKYELGKQVIRNVEDTESNLLITKLNFIPLRSGVEEDMSSVAVVLSVI